MNRFWPELPPRREKRGGGGSPSPQRIDKLYGAAPLASDQLQEVITAKRSDGVLVKRGAGTLRRISQALKPAKQGGTQLADTIGASGQEMATSTGRTQDSTRQCTRSSNRQLQREGNRHRTVSNSPIILIQGFIPVSTGMTAADLSYPSGEQGLKDGNVPLPGIPLPLVEASDRH